IHVSARHLSYHLALHDALPICGGDTGGEGEDTGSGDGGDTGSGGGGPGTGGTIGDGSGGSGGTETGNVELPTDPEDGDGNNFPRSEEHTSELQSRENLVCRLLL